MTRANICRTLFWGLGVVVSAVNCNHSTGSQDDDVELEISTSGTGVGHVSNSAGPGSCPPLCILNFDGGDAVTLTATPSIGSVFGEWSGDCDGTSATVNLTLLNNAECDARFDLDGSVATLNVVIDSAAGSTGKVTGTGIDCGNGGTDCTETYALNSSVHLTVTRPAGSIFKGWSDDCLAFTSTPEIDLTMNGDKSCKASFDLESGGLQPKGSFSFGYRVEAAGLVDTKIITTGYDNPAGEIIDVSNIEVLTSAPGNEFNSCGAARGAIIFNSTRQQYGANVFFATCTINRFASTTLATGGFSELQNLGYAPGKVAHYQNNWLAIADFENGRLRRSDQSDNPQPGKFTALTPGERSCPFSLTLRLNYAYVVGREGVAGTSTENCNNWVGVWKVDLSLDSLISFTRFGTKLRDVAYGSDDRLYVTDFEEDKVYVVNSGTMAVERSIAVGDGPVGLKLNAMATGMWVTNWNSNKIQYWNLTNDTLFDEENSGGVHPVDVLVSGTRGFVVNFGDTTGNIGASIRAFEY